MRTFELPAIWAPALVNDDYSGLDANDENELNVWYLNNVPGMACIDVSTETNFGQFKGIGHELATFTFKSLIIE